MKQCIKCGKKGIFLRIYNGRICKNCIEVGIRKRKAWGATALMSSRKFLGNYKKADSQFNRMSKAISEAEKGNYNYAIETYDIEGEIVNGQQPLYQFIFGLE